MNIYGHEINIAYSSFVFGDGAHETTRFLLYFLNRYADGKTVIDAGCGTGILAIFAAKRGARSVTAIDIDQNAVECAKENIRLNEVDVEVYRTAIDALKISADIVTANFARHEAMYLLPHMAKASNDLIITTWYKEIPKEPLRDFEIVDCIEGVDYDCYVLRTA